MQCFNCKREYSGLAIDQRTEILQRFFPIAIWPAFVDIMNGQSNDDNVSTIGHFYAGSLFSKPGFAQQYAALRERFYAVKIKCPQCGQELYYDALQNVEHSIHSFLVGAERDLVFHLLKDRCGKDIQDALRLVGGEQEAVRFALANLGDLFDEQLPMLRDSDAFIETLRFRGGRGGDFISGALSVIRDYLTNEFLKNAIYDLIKGSGLFLLGFLTQKIRKKKIKDAAEKKLREAGEQKTYYGSDLPSLFVYLTEREKAALAKKLVARMAKDRLRTIRKSLK